MDLPDGWVAVFRWDEVHKCVQQVTRPNRTACGGRRRGMTYHDAGIGWLVEESSPEAKAEVGRREWCPGCVEALGGRRDRSGGGGDVRAGDAEAPVRIGPGRS